MSNHSFLSGRKQRSIERQFQKLDRKKAKEAARARRRGGDLPGHRNWAPLDRSDRVVPQWLVTVVVLGVLFAVSFWVTVS